MIIGHGGNIFEAAKLIGCKPTDIIDMSSNMNPLGPFPGLMAHLSEKLPSILALPQPDAYDCITAFAARNRVPPENVLVANGTTQFIYTLPRALKTKKALILGPTYADYADACRMHNVPYGYFTTEAIHAFKVDLNLLAASIENADTIFICNPNNPTGVLIPEPDVTDICRLFPDKQFIIDEAYMPFVNRDENFSMMPSKLSNVIVLNSMSKIFRVPGLRIGCLVAPSRTIDQIRQYLMPWSLNSLAQAAILYLMEHGPEVERFVEKTQIYLEDEKRFICEQLKKISNIEFFPNKTPFILARVTGGHTAESVIASMLCSRILLRNCSNFAGLNNLFIRISLKKHDINRFFSRTLQKVLSSTTGDSKRKVT